MMPFASFKVIRKRQPFSVGFKITVVVAVVVVVGVAASLISEAWNPGRYPEVVSDSVTVIRNVEYGQAGPSPLKLDVYQPRSWSLKPRPALLLIHGGGWIEGDKSSEADLATFLVPEGFVAFAINYRLASGGRDCYPAQALDVRRAARWVRRHASEFGADADRLGAVGWRAPRGAPGDHRRG